MDSEKKAEQQMGEYLELAKTNKNIDTAALMINVLEQTRRDEIDAKKKRTAYLVSIGIPPLGFLFALRWYLSGKDDGKRVALTCVILTLISLFIAWGVASLMASSANVSSGGNLDQQLQDVDLNELKELLQ